MLKLLVHHDYISDLHKSLLTSTVKLTIRSHVYTSLQAANKNYPYLLYHTEFYKVLVNIIEIKQQTCISMKLVDKNYHYFLKLVFQTKHVFLERLLQELKVALGID